MKRRRENGDVEKGVRIEEEQRNEINQTMASACRKISKEFHFYV